MLPTKPNGKSSGTPALRTADTPQLPAELLTLLPPDIRQAVERQGSRITGQTLLTMLGIEKITQAEMYGNFQIFSNWVTSRELNQAFADAPRELREMVNRRSAEYAQVIYEMLDEHHRRQREGARLPEIKESSAKRLTDWIHRNW